MEGTNPCQRCVVPTRDSLTGAASSGFATEFARRRAATLPPWADRRRFDHFYRLTVNTRLASWPGISPRTHRCRGPGSIAPQREADRVAQVPAA